MKTGSPITKSAVAVALVVLAMGLFATSALAETSDSSATLTGGDLNISSALTAGTFSDTLEGAAQVLDGSGFTGFQVNDPRGTGVGWTMTLKAGQFSTAGGTPHVMALDSLTAPKFTVEKNDAGSSAVPGTLHDAATIDNATGVVMVACSAAGQGMGTYDFSATASSWKLAVTADEYAGTYTSTITTTLATQVQ